MMSINQSGLIALIGSLSFLAQFARADISLDIAEASAPVSEGVPEVAVVRLQALLAKQLSDPEWRAVVEKLAEAQIAARQPEATLVLLADARVRGLPWVKFWRAQALAGLKR